MTERVEPEMSQTAAAPRADGARYRGLIAAIFVLYFAFGSAYSLLFPMWQVTDEISHYLNSRHHARSDEPSRGPHRETQECCERNQQRRVRAPILNEHDRIDDPSLAKSQDSVVEPRAGPP